MKLLFEIDKKNYDPNGKAFCRPSARALIFREGKLAVIYSHAHKFYKIPGGGIEEGEDMVEAMIREVKEEVGLTVIPKSVREYGYVRRIQKGHYEPVFIQDNYYYFCEVEEKQVASKFSESEKKEGFEAQFVALEEAIKVNEDFLKENHDDGMIDRELRIMKMVQKEINQV